MEAKLGVNPYLKKLVSKLATIDPSWGGQISSWSIGNLGVTGCSNKNYL